MDERLALVIGARVRAVRVAKHQTQVVVAVVPHELPPVAELRGHVRSAWRIWQTSPYRYSKLAHQLPVLITDIELAEQRYRREGARGRASGTSRGAVLCRRSVWLVAHGR
jgi:hypothetical protein